MTSETEQRTCLVATPEAVGIPSQAISGFLDALKHQGYCLHAFMLMRHNQLCFSSAVAPYTLDTPHRVFSTGKSILVLSVFFAIQEGYLRFEDKVADYCRDLLGEDTSFDAMTVRDLLTMRSGQVGDAFPAILTDLDADLIQLFFQTPLVEAPGKTFRYNNTIPHIVYALVERATGMPFEQYQNTHLCKPLDAPIDAPTNPKGQYNPVVMAMSANTLLKIARFYLQEGLWEGKSLLGAAYIREAVQLQTLTGLAGNSAEYGYQIWRNAFGGYRMDGGWGQFAIVLPQENLVAVILSDMPDASFALTAFENEIVKRLSPAPLPENAQAHQRLQALGAQLTLAPQGARGTWQNEGLWLNQVFHFPQQKMDIQFANTDETIEITIVQNHKTTTFRCGLEGKWVQNPAHLLVTPEQTIDNGVYCVNKDECMLSGAWQSEQIFEMVSKSFGALGLYRYRFTFSGTGLTLAYPTHVERGCDGLQNPICIHSEGSIAPDECSRP